MPRNKARKSEIKPAAEEAIERIGTLPIIWEGADDVPVLAVNQVLSQFHNGQFVLTLGIMVPPPLIGDKEDRIEQLKRYDYLAIRPAARLGFGREFMQALIEVLQRNLKAFDKAATQVTEEEAQE